MALILRYFTKFGIVSGAHCVKLVDKAITMDTLRLLCLLVNVCRGTAILDFQNLKFLTFEKVTKVELHQRAKFTRNRLNCGRDMVIFVFFKSSAAAILHFQNLNFLTFVMVKRVELHHRAKFRRNRSNRGRDIAIFWFFKMAAAAILDF